MGFNQQGNQTFGPLPFFEFDPAPASGDRAAGNQALGPVFLILIVIPEVAAYPAKRL